jgi:hypothetical protein
METKSLLNLMWKASIDSNWSKEAHLDPKESLLKSQKLHKTLLGRIPIWIKGF